MENNNDKWIDAVIGKPFMPHFEAKAKIAKKWGINYEPLFLGCVVDDELLAEREAREKSNEAYFAKLEAKFGKDWRKKFDAEVKQLSK